MSLKVFKFGGASVQDAQGIRRLLSLLRTYGDGPLWVVVSAMGKTTNLLERLVQACYEDRWPEAMEYWGMVHDTHMERIGPLAKDLEAEGSRDAGTLEQTLDAWLALLREDMDLQRTKGLSYNAFYDQIVCYGELVSTALVSAYLKAMHFGHRWVDARELVRTDATWRDARIQWTETTRLLKARNLEVSSEHAGPVLIQGFIGKNHPTGLTTTLGREGSDFTASVIAHALEAEEVWVWKDVEGVMDADPRLFPMARVLPQLTYLEAVEMTYYGASVIHPKTIQPLQNKGIPLRVRSFLYPSAAGTVIAGHARTGPPSACVIVKKNQCLLEMVAKDFSFISEEGLALIYRALYEQGLKANLARHTAVSFSLCVDNDPYKRVPVQESLADRFEIRLTEGLSLWTLMHQSEKMRKGLLSGKQILFEQHINDVFQYVLVE